MLYEELCGYESGGELAANFATARDAMRHVLANRLTTYEESFFGDDQFMEAEYDAVREFIMDNGLTATEEEE